MARPDELTFAPLGGVGEIGMNLSIYGLGNRHQRSWLAVDLGVSFGDEEHLPGIDLIMPDIRYLEAERKNLVGIVLTHAHEDHFGALIDLWPKLKCPIYATRFSAALFQAKLEAERNPPKIPVNVVPSGGRIDLGPFEPRPGIVVGIGRIDPSDRVGRNAALGLVARKGIEWRRCHDTAKIPDDGFHLSLHGTTRRRRVSRGRRGPQAQAAAGGQAPPRSPTRDDRIRSRD